MEVSKIITDILIVFGFVSLAYFAGERLKVNPLVGFLVSGIFLGTEFLGILPKSVGEVFAEIGIVFLLFSIGLHINFKELLGMRKYVLNLGLIQVGFTGIVLALSYNAIAYFFGFQPSLWVSIILAVALALSSSAIVMEKLINDNLVGTELGNAKIGILLFQDLIAPLVLVFIPIVAAGKLTLETFNDEIASMIGFLTLTVFGILIISRFSAKLLKSVSSSDKKGDETVVWILIALISGAISHYFGMSYGIGAFIGGVVFGQTEHKEKALETIEGIKEIFVAMFFIYVGTLIDVSVVVENAVYVLALAVFIKIVKVFSTYVSCRMLKIGERNSWIIGLNLSQVSEFSLVIVAGLSAYGLISSEGFQIINSAIILTMVFSILLIERYEYLARRIFFTKPRP